MTSPPAHLLPLALEAITSADACEVLGDALLESGWCDWRIMDVRSGVAVPASPLDMAAEMKASRAVIEALIRDPRSPFTSVRLRAIAAVLLFGDWVWGERWPLVEAHEALSPGPFLAQLEHLVGMLDDRTITVDQVRELADMTMRAEGLRAKHPDDEEDDDADLG